MSFYSGASHVSIEPEINLKNRPKVKITMSISSFLYQLLDDREIDLSELHIVQDNAKLEEKPRKIVTPKREEKLCRWSLTGKVEMPRLDSAPCLNKPSRRESLGVAQLSSNDSAPCLNKPSRRESLGGAQLSSNDAMNSVRSESSFLRLPQPRKSMNNSGNINYNATWNEVDLLHKPERRKSIQNQGNHSNATWNDVLVVPQRRMSILNQKNWDFNTPTSTTNAGSSDVPQRRRMSILNQCCVNDIPLLAMPQRRQSILNQGNTWDDNVHMNQIMMPRSDPNPFLNRTEVKELAN
jgi:hypothetical protein